MTGFSLGLVATLLWIVVLTGLGLSFRTAPKTADQSIREFRSTRRRISKVEDVPEPPIDASREAAEKRRLAEGGRSEESPRRKPETNRPRTASRRQAARTASGMRRAPAATLSGPAPITVSIQRGARAATRPGPAAAAGTTDSEIDDLIRTLMEPSAVAPASGSLGGAAEDPQPQGSYSPGPSSLQPQPPVESSPAPPASPRPRSDGNTRIPVATFSKTYARSDGKVTYVVVDDDGRPQPVQ